jgi:hypothetical protein
MHHAPIPAPETSRALIDVNAADALRADTANAATFIGIKRRTLVNTLQRNFTMLVVALCGVMVFLAVLAMSLAGEI